MRVAYFLDAFPAVSETFVLAQIVAAVRRGHEVDIYGTRPVPTPAMVHPDVLQYRLLAKTIYPDPVPASISERMLQAGPRILRWGIHAPALTLDCLNVFRYGTKALSLRIALERLPSARCRRNYDVIHCHFGPNGLRAVRQRRAGTLRGPILTTFHGYDANLLPRIHGPEMYRELFGAGELFTVGSEFMRRRIVSLGAPRDRIVKLPMGVDLSRFPFAPRRRGADGKIRLLTVARLVEVKGIEYALRALALLKDKYPDLLYEVAGDGPLLDRLQGLSAELGLAAQVRFLGAVNTDAARELYGSAHIFLLPSVVTERGEEENQPVVLAEAQASGLPVVATDVGGVRESVLPGRSGLLVPQRDPEALASAISRLADHPESWGRMGEAGRSLAAERFDQESLQDRLLEIYGELSSSAGARSAGRVFR